jgi:hypothetical protein
MYSGTPWNIEIFEKVLTMPPTVIAFFLEIKGPARSHQPNPSLSSHLSLYFVSRVHMMRPTLEIFLWVKIRSWLVNPPSKHQQQQNISCLFLNLIDSLFSVNKNLLFYAGDHSFEGILIWLRMRSECEFEFHKVQLYYCTDKDQLK